MDQVLQFLTESRVFYMATCDGDQPRVRPFGAVLAVDGKLYFCTNKDKKVCAQMKKNPKVEISATTADFRWLRLWGRAVFEDNRAVKTAFLEKMPMLVELYKSADNPVFEVFFLAEAGATIEAMDGRPAKTIKL